MYNVMKYADSNPDYSGWAIYWEEGGEARFVRDVKGVPYNFADKEDAENLAATLHFGWQRNHVFPELVKQIRGIEKK